MSDSPEINWIARLGGDPTLRFTNGGKAVCSGSAVVSRKWKDKDDEWQEVPMWFRYSAWDKMAENIAQSLVKGDLVFVKGILENREYEDRESGEKRQSLEVRVDHMGPTLKWNPCEIERTERRNDAEERQPAKKSGGTRQAAKQRPANDRVEEEFGDDYIDPTQEPF